MIARPAARLKPCPFAPVLKLGEGKSVQQLGNVTQNHYVSAQSSLVGDPCHNASVKAAKTIRADF